MAHVWTIFLMLMQKDWILSLRNCNQLVFKILFPICVCGVLLALRLTTPKEFVLQPYIYEPLPIANKSAYRSEELNWTVVYSPNTLFYEILMLDVKSIMNLTSIHGFHSSSELHGYLLQHEQFMPLAGVMFDNPIEVNLPNETNNLRCKLQFPAELRFPIKPLDTGWRLNLLYPEFPSTVPRRPRSATGGPPSYYDEQFIALQSAISIAFIKLQKNESIVLPEIQLQRFPYPATNIDSFFNYGDTAITLVFMFILLPMIHGSVRLIAEEKENTHYETMKLLGVTRWMHWTIWFTKNVISMSLTLILLLIVLKVPFKDNLSIFMYSKTSTICVFLLMYVISVMCYTFMISVMFNDSNLAIMLAELTTIASFIPYFLTKFNFSDLSFTLKICLTLFHNTCVAFGLDIIIQHEFNCEGVNWGNFFLPKFYDGLSVGTISVMLGIDALIYLIIALFVDEIHTQADRFNFPVISDAELLRSDSHPNYEPYTSRKSSVQIYRLRKLYKNRKPAVKSASLRIFEDEVTVLLGQNGCGKSTIFSVLTGQFLPTLGTAIVYKFDVRLEIKKARVFIGLCPQADLLIDELTGREHIYFVSRVKGQSHSEAVETVDKYAQLLQIEDIVNKRTKTVTHVEKRKICVAMAMASKAKLILIDEPTSGMDGASKRLIWNLIEREKRNRTIIVATNSIEEADFIGDRIAIMQSGDIKCYGSPMFLKRNFGRGYQLICEKGYYADEKATTGLIRHYFPGVKIESNVGTELAYKLNLKHSQYLKMLLEDLESHRAYLGLEGYHLSYYPFHRVYNKVTFEEEPFVELNPEFNGFKLDTGLGLYFSHVWAVLYRKVHYTLSHKALFFFQMTLPIILFTIVLNYYEYFAWKYQMIPLEIKFKSYNNDPIALISNNSNTDPTQAEYIMHYKRYVRQVENATILRVNTVSEYILGLPRHYFMNFNLKTLVGFSIQNNSIISWFNNHPYHTAPLSLNLVFNAVLREFCRTCSITMINDPLPQTFKIYKEQLKDQYDFGFGLAVTIGFAMSFTMSLFIVPHIKDRASGLKRMQLIYGLKLWIYWIIAFLWDFFEIKNTIFLMMIDLWFYRHESFQSFDHLIPLYLLVTCFTYAVFPYMYVMSLFVNNPTRGFRLMVEICCLGGCCLFVVGVVLKPLLKLYIVTDIGSTWAFLVLPPYTLMDGVLILQANNLLSKICEINAIVVKTTNYTCTGRYNSMKSQCNSLNTYGWNENGIGIHLIYLASFGTFFFIVLFLLEAFIFNSESHRNSSQALTNVDTDVMKERNRVKNIRDHELKSHFLVVRNLTKYYGSKLAVNQISFAVAGGECFGILGLNTSGKSTLLKMLGGEVFASSGDAFVLGVSLTKNLAKANTKIGYCPQNDSLLDELTGRETMTMFGFLKGIPIKYIGIMIVRLSNELYFKKLLDKRVRDYRRVDRRKLNIAIALLGYPFVVYLDDPTHGMDPYDKRCVWQVIENYVQTGRSVILGSTNVEECEVLCTRFAIIANGELKCLGSSRHLRNKFSYGLVLIIQVGRKVANLATEIFNIRYYLEYYLIGAAVREIHESRIVYNISHSTMSAVYTIIEIITQRQDIESYVLSQTSLDQIFRSLSKSGPRY